MKLLIPEKDNRCKWLCINQSTVFDCYNEEISEEELKSNIGWTLVLPKRDSKRAFHRRMKKKYSQKKNIE